MDFRIPRLYAIIDRARTGPLSPQVMADALLSAGVRLIQYRDKQGTARELFEASREIGARVRAVGGIFIVNDRADVARVAGAAGVHLGQGDLPVERARRVLAPYQKIGVSTHNRVQAEDAGRSSADYIALGPIFATRSKERPGPEVGLDGLRAVRGLAGKPLVAIGGITAGNARSVIEAGADSVAVIQALLPASDAAVRARELLQALGEL